MSGFSDHLGLRSVYINRGTEPLWEKGVMMNPNLSDITAKIDALRAADFTDDQINAILSNSAPQAQPSTQADMTQPESMGVYQFLKSSPSSIPVTDGMTDSDRTYAQEWNKRIDKLSFFFGWKADAIGYAVILLAAWPLLVSVISSVIFKVPNEDTLSFEFVMGWLFTSIVVIFAAVSYINHCYFLPNVRFLLKKRLS